jgi:serine/threonine protein phosphatase PrpC
MNSSSRFTSKSHRLAHPVAGVQLFIHRTCWPLLPLLLFQPPLFAPPNLLAHVCSVLAVLVSLGLAALVQLLGQALTARRLGAQVAEAFLFPFGLMLAAKLDALPVHARQVVWLAGPLLNLALGALLVLSKLPLLDGCGHVILAYGLLSLAPCYPLPGGFMMRELLGVTGSGAPDVDRQTLEVTRISSCVLAILALLNFSLALLYALLVLWVIAHLALVPALDLAGVKASTLGWFRARWTALREQVKRNFADLFLVLVVFTSTAFVHAGSKREPTPAQVMSAVHTQAERLSLLETNVLRLAEHFADLAHQLRQQATNNALGVTLAQGRLQQELTVITSRVGILEKAFAQTAKTLEVDLARAKKDFTRPLAPLATTLQAVSNRGNQLQSRIAGAEVATGQLQAQVQRLQHDAQSLLGQVQTLTAQTDQALAARDRRISQSTAGLAVLVLIGISAFGAAAVRLHRRIRALEPLEEKLRFRAASGGASLTEEVIHQRPASETPQGEPESAPSGYEAVAGDERATPSHLVPASPGVRVGADLPAAAPGRSAEAILSRPIPEPAQLLQRLIATAQRSRHLLTKPCPPREVPWNIGWATSKGAVRPKNEDFALAFQIACCQVALVADGVSGEPFGQTAAYFAVQSAAWSIIKQLGAAWSWSCPNPLTVATVALQAAARCLGRIGAGARCSVGLHTTLIVVVATPKQYGYAYIGDGKGCILRAAGTEEDFLVPQRAEADAPHVIAACLGPTLLGSPRTGSLPRLPGDLLIIGTDGVFTESVQWPADLTKSLLRAAFHFQGDLQRTVDQALAELSAAADQTGFLFEDNLSLLLLGDGTAPRLAPDFWAASQPSEPQAGEHANAAPKTESWSPSPGQAAARNVDQP